MAQMYFYKSEYERVLTELQNVVYKDMNYNLASKVLMSATYYELDALEVLSSFFESYRIYLNRNKKVSKKRKAMHSNFIKYLKALINNSINKKKIVVLQARLKEEKLVVNKTWLLSKMDERLTQ